MAGLCTPLPTPSRDCARLGADVGRYSFIVVDLHHLLLAGLPAHGLPLLTPEGDTRSNCKGLGLRGWRSKRKAVVIAH